MDENIDVEAVDGAQGDEPSLGDQIEAIQTTLETLSEQEENIAAMSFVVVTKEKYRDHDGDMSHGMGTWGHHRDLSQYDSVWEVVRSLQKYNEQLEEMKFPLENERESEAPTLADALGL